MPKNKVIKNWEPLDHRMIRAALIKRGSSMAAWARANGYSKALVEKVVHNERRGPTAMKIFHQIKREGLHRG